jgi:proteasome accessory factor C
MSPRAVPLATLLSVVPYFHARGAVRVADAARDLGMTEAQLRGALWQLWSCGLPGYGPGDLIDLAFSAEDLDDAELVEVTFTAGIDRPVRLTAAEAVTLETGLAVFLDHPEVVDQAALRDLLDTLRSAAGVDGGAIGGGASSPAPAPEADTVRTAVHRGRALRFVYHSASSDTSTMRVVDPARISVADGHSYVHGVDRATGEWRTFRTDRMSGVEDVGERRELGPEPQDPGGDAGRSEPATVRASGAWFLDEYPFGDMTRRPGDVEVSVSSHDRAWLARFLLGHADVVTPSDPGLVAEIAARAAEGLAHYGSDPAAG